MKCQNHCQATAIQGISAVLPSAPLASNLLFEQRCETFEMSLLLISQKRKDIPCIPLKSPSHLYIQIKGICLEGYGKFEDRMQLLVLRPEKRFIYPDAAL